MAIAFQTVGNTVAGTNSAAVPVPAGVVAGNLLIMSIGFKYNDSFTAPADWTPVLNIASGSAGSNGIDTGFGSVKLFYKIATTAQTGTVTISNGSGNAMVGRMYRYSYDQSKVVSLRFIPMSKNGATGTAWSTSGTDYVLATSATTFPLQPGDITVGDVLLACSGINTNGPTYSGQTVSIDGVTFNTAIERDDTATALGQDCKSVVSEHTVASGSNVTGTLAYSMTASTSGANFPAGGTMVVIMREVDPPAATSFDDFGMMGFFGI